MAALSKRHVKEILEAIRELGGKTTVAALAQKLGRDVNGMSQTLSNNAKLAGLIMLGDEKAGERTVELTEAGRSRGTLFEQRPADPGAPAGISSPAAYEPTRGQQSLFKM